MPSVSSKIADTLVSTHAPISHSISEGKDVKVGAVFEVPIKLTENISLNPSPISFPSSKP